MAWRLTVPSAQQLNPDKWGKMIAKQLDSVDEQT